MATEYAAATLTDLRNLSTSGLDTGDFAVVNSNLSVYFYSKTGDEADDNYRIITPSSNTGKWYRCTLNLTNVDISILGAYIGDSIKNIGSGGGGAGTGGGLTYNLILSNADLQLQVNNGYYFNLDFDATIVNAKMPLTATLGDTIQIYANVGKVNIVPSVSDSYFTFKGKPLSNISAFSLGTAFSLSYVGGEVGWVPLFNYSLNTTRFVDLAAARAEIKGISSLAVWIKAEENYVTQSNGFLTSFVNDAPGTPVSVPFHRGNAATLVANAIGIRSVARINGSDWWQYGNGVSNVRTIFVVGNMPPGEHNFYYTSLFGGFNYHYISSGNHPYKWGVSSEPQAAGFTNATISTNGGTPTAALNTEFLQVPAIYKLNLSQDTSILASTNQTQDNASYFFPGDIAEMLVFTSVLGQTDSDYVQGYLAAKYNLG